MCAECAHMTGKIVAKENSTHIQYGCKKLRKAFTDRDGDIGWCNRHKWKRCNHFKQRGS